MSKIKFKDVAKGARAIKRVRCPLVNVPSHLLPDVPELVEQRARDAKRAGKPEDAAPSEVVVGLRVLTGAEILEIYDKAAQIALGRNQKADLSSPIYELAVSVYTLAASCVCADSDPDKPIPFFGDAEEPGAGVENWESAYSEILASNHLGRDGILFLSEQQAAWQDICNPQALKVGSNRLWELAAEVAADDTGRPFFSMRPALQWSFARFMAVQLLSLMSFKSQPGSDSPSDGTNAPSAEGA